MTVTPAHHRGSIRISRSEWVPADRGRFQPEWEPVEDPYLLTDDPKPLKIRRIPRRYSSYVMSVAVSVAMSAVITLFVTVRNAGLSFDTTLLWLAAWPASCMIAVPTRFAIGPLVEKITTLLVEPPMKQN